MTTPNAAEFAPLAAEHPGALVPVYRRLFADALTPVLAYRRLVRPDPRMASSFLLESVSGGDRIGRYSVMGTSPAVEVLAREFDVEVRDHRAGADEPVRRLTSDDPLAEMDRVTGGRAVADVPGLPEFSGGWVGYAGYDTVRYLEREKVPFASAPPDDRGLADLHMQLYLDVVVFDHVQKTVLAITHAETGPGTTAEAAYAAAEARLDALTDRLTAPVTDAELLPPGHLDLAAPPPTLPTSSLGEGGYQSAVERCKEYIRAGDAFQIVPSQRFSLATSADPFDIYRALRVVNPSPYMFYLQAEGAILVGSSPEILVKVEEEPASEPRAKLVTSRPLAGTRRRGATTAEDTALEDDLLADPKDRAEHIMLVDLHRNDIGRVAVPGTITLPEVLTVERYSHVMHISSQVTGRLRPGLSVWEALRVSLPVGTVSGAPKVRAMQIIDELEATRRGPYAGAVGCADLHGNMDMAIALRTMVVLPGEQGGWAVHIQAGGGIVADSDPDAEHQETVNKAAALAKAVQLAEAAFT